MRMFIMCFYIAGQTKYAQNSNFFTLVFFKEISIIRGHSHSTYAKKTSFRPSLRMQKRMENSIEIHEP